MTGKHRTVGLTIAATLICAFSLSIALRAEAETTTPSDAARASTSIDGRGAGPGSTTRNQRTKSKQIKPTAAKKCMELIRFHDDFGNVPRVISMLEYFARVGLRYQRPDLTESTGALYNEAVSIREGLIPRIYFHLSRGLSKWKRRQKAGAQRIWNSVKEEVLPDVYHQVDDFRVKVGSSVATVSDAAAEQGETYPSDLTYDIAVAFDAAYAPLDTCAELLGATFR